MGNEIIRTPNKIETCFWISEIEWPYEVVEKPFPEASEVVVIGGGFTGLSAARSLALAGVDVVLLEKEELGFGASSRNGGIVHPTLGRRGCDTLRPVSYLLVSRLF